MVHVKYTYFFILFMVTVVVRVRRNWKTSITIDYLLRFKQGSNSELKFLVYTTCTA